MDLREKPTDLHDRHPWEVVRFDFFSRVCTEAIDGHGPVNVLDVGAGDGWFSRRLISLLPEGSSITCWDAMYTDGDLACGDVEAPLGIYRTSVKPPGRFDVLLLLDVLEHVDGDDEFLEDLVLSNLHEGGHVLVSVPAWMILFSDHDEALGHHRRYSPRSGRDLLARCGLSPIEGGGLFHSLVMPRTLRKVCESIDGGKLPPPGNLGTWKHGRVVTGAVVAALRVDNMVSRALSTSRFDLPGTSWWCLCKK